MHRTIDKHEFALYVPDVMNIMHIKDTNGVFDDQTVYHRMIRVLRLKQNDFVIVFDRTMHMRCQIQTIQEQVITVRILEKEPNVLLKPVITCVLPLLKRDALEVALYALSEMGINEVQLLITEKVQRKWGESKEMDRLERINIAAAEQAKHFSLLKICTPMELHNFLPTVAHDTIPKIFFDPTGLHLQAVLKQLPAAFDRCIMFVGPEADLSIEEKTILRDAGFLFCALTPTILRAQQAVALGAGLLRSFFYSSSPESSMHFKSGD